MSRKFDFDDDDLALDESSDDGVSMAILKADPAAGGSMCWGGPFAW